jgi:hypothetical protein
MTTTACGTTCDGSCGWCRLTAELNTARAQITEMRLMHGRACDERDSLKTQNKQLWELAYPDGPGGDAGFSCAAYEKAVAERDALEKANQMAYEKHVELETSNGRLREALIFARQTIENCTAMDCPKALARIDDALYPA